MTIATAAPFKAPTVDSLAVRLVVDSYFDLFMPKATHSHCRIEHVSRIPGRENSTLACDSPSAASPLRPTTTATGT